jgi:hypothetical protein
MNFCQDVWNSQSSWNNLANAEGFFVHSWVTTVLASSACSSRQKKDTETPGCFILLYVELNSNISLHHSVHCEEGANCLFHVCVLRDRR